VEASVNDPDRLSSLGLFAVRMSDRGKMLCIGSNVRRIKHPATGLAIAFAARLLQHVVRQLQVQSRRAKNGYV